MIQLLVIAKAPVPGRVKTRLCPPCTPAEAAQIAAAALADTLKAALATPAIRHTLVLDGFHPAPPDTGEVFPALPGAGEVFPVPPSSGRNFPAPSGFGESFPPPPGSGGNFLAPPGGGGDLRAPLGAGGNFPASLVVDGNFPAPAGWNLVPQRGDGLGERLANAFADTALPGVPALLIGMDTPQVTTELLRDAAARLLRAGSVLGPAEDGGWWALGLTDPAAASVLAGVPMSTAETGARTLAALREIGVCPAPLPPLRDVDTIADALAVAAACPPGSHFPAAVTGVVDAAGEAGAVGVVEAVGAAGAARAAEVARIGGVIA